MSLFLFSDSVSNERKKKYFEDFASFQSTTAHHHNVQIQSYYVNDILYKCNFITAYMHTKKVLYMLCNKLFKKRLIFYIYYKINNMYWSVIGWIHMYMTYVQNLIKHTHTYL